MVQELLFSAPKHENMCEWHSLAWTLHKHKNFDFFVKIQVRDLDPKFIPWGRIGADKNLSPISTIRPNMNEIYQRVFII